MRMYQVNGGGFRMGAITVGGALILIGLLLFIWPELLAFVVASFFVVAGIGVLGTAWGASRNVTYHRMDESGESRPGPW